MPNQFTLELLATADPILGNEQSIALEIKSHVHNRVERFVYTPQVKDSSIPIAYLENKRFDAWSNLQISNRTYTIPTNAPKQVETGSTFDRIRAVSFSTVYRDLAVTNREHVDNNGRIRPLFSRHSLALNTTQCELEIVTQGNRIDVDTGYILDLDKDVIFTNYKNYFNPDTGAYKLFFLTSTDSSGVVTNELLNPVPAAKLATWEDIDLDTGMLTDKYPVYNRERNASGYTYYFNNADTWFMKPLENGLIQPRRPSGKDAQDPWFIRFTNGDFSALTNGSIRRYYIPEYHQQPFVPSKPIVFSSISRMLQVNKNVIAATRQNLNISPTDGLHVKVFIRDIEDQLLKVLSTDVSLEGKRYSDTNVFYETDKITSWDNSAGLIVLGLDVLPEWQLSASYYYNADDYEYTALSLNPLNDQSLFDNLFVFYIVPDVDLEDRSIHHLVVNQAGFITYCSQSLGLAHPNLQLKNSDGSFNPNTVVGLKYSSETITNTFLNKYAVGYVNDNAYGILAEVSVLDTGLVEDQYSIDLRQPGGRIKESAFADVVRANPRILQSHLGYGEDGQEVPENEVMVLKAPLTLLEEWGGVLQEKEVEALLRGYLPSTNAAVIEYEYPAAELTGHSLVAAQVDLSATWEGPGLTYHIYRRTNPIDEWLLLATIVSPAEGTVLYTDTAVISNRIYYYSVRIVDGNNEFPAGNSLGVMVS